MGITKPLGCSASLAFEEVTGGRGLAPKRLVVLNLNWGLAGWPTGAAPPSSLVLMNFWFTEYSKRLFTGASPSPESDFCCARSEVVDDRGFY